MAESHVFAHLSDDGGLYHREIRLETDGSLVIIGHDLGEREYEFERRVPPDGVRRLLASIGADSEQPSTPCGTRSPPHTRSRSASRSWASPPSSGTGSVERVERL